MLVVLLFAVLEATIGRQLQSGVPSSPPPMECIDCLSWVYCVSAPDAACETEMPRFCITCIPQPPGAPPRPPAPPMIPPPSSPPSSPMDQPRLPPAPPRVPPLPPLVPSPTSPPMPPVPSWPTMPCTLGNGFRYMVDSYGSACARSHDVVHEALASFPSFPSSLSHVTRARQTFF